MIRRFANIDIALVIALLVAQAALFLLSMDAGGSERFSIFCTGPASSGLGLAFSLLHLFLALLVPLGLTALRFARVRLVYAGLTLLVLAMLPLQANLVKQGVLTCDAP